MNFKIFATLLQYAVQSFSICIWPTQIIIVACYKYVKTRIAEHNQYIFSGFSNFPKQSRARIIVLAECVWCVCL